MPLVLRGYQKTPVLQPGQNASLLFRLSSRDLSVWSEAPLPSGPTPQLGGWRRVGGAFTAHVGSSSRILPLQHTFTVDEVG